MEGGFTVELFDLLVYLIPGAISLAAIYFGRHRVPERSQDGTTKVPGIIGALVIAFSLGVVAHIVAAGLTGVFARVSGTFVIERTTARFNEFGLVRQRVLARIQVRNPDVGDFYRYAETYVTEKAGKQSASFSRLLALSLFCRNSIIPLAILGTVVCVKEVKRKRRKLALLIVSATAAGVVILAVGYYMYYAVAVTKVLRTFLVLQAF